MKKIESDYIEEYGNIPRNEINQLGYLMKNMKFKNRKENFLIDSIMDVLNKEWKRIDFTIYLLPKATPRPRINYRLNTFYVSGAKDNKDIFKKFIMNCDTELITTPCKFKCESYFPIPKSMTNVEKILAELGLIRPITKPDWDNIGKTYSDMIQGFLLLDDSLIIEGTSKKFYSSKPRIEIHIEYMKEYDCLYNEKKIRKKVK